MSEEDTGRGLGPQPGVSLRKEEHAPSPRVAGRGRAIPLYASVDYLWIDQPAAAALASFMKVVTVSVTSAPSPMSWSMFHQEVRAWAQPEVT